MIAMTGDEIVARVRAGHGLRLSGSMSYASRFEDGTMLPHQVMSRLMDAGRLALPDGLHAGSAWVIAQAAAADVPSARVGERT